MTKSSKRLRLYLILVALVTVTTVTLRTLALMLHLGDDLIYYDSTMLITIASVITAALCLFSLSYCFIPKQNITPASTFVNPQTYIPSGLAAIALIFVGIELIFALQNFYAEPAKTTSSIIPAVLVLSILFSFASVICFFLNVFFEKRESRTRAASTLAVVMFLALYAGYLFFSTDLPLNSPNKSVDQLAHLALAIFFLYETRISLGRSLWKPYVSFGMMAASLSFFSSVPSLIFYFANGASQEAMVSASVAENILVLVLGIYVSCRLSLLLTLVPDEACDFALAVEKMSKIREDELSAAEIERTMANVDEKIEPQVVDSSHLEGTNYEMDIASLTDSQDGQDTRQEKEY